MLSAAVAATALLLTVSSCSGDDKDSSAKAGSSQGPAAPDGSYTSETGPNEEAVTFEVEDGAITHLKGKTYGDCEGVTVSESIDGDVNVAIEDDSVAYENDANGVTTTLTGTFKDGSFTGTFAYVRADATCPTAPFEFTAS